MSRNRKTAKEVLTIKMQIKRGLLASAAKAEKAPPVNTWSAAMPAYCYTVACPDPRLRKPIFKGTIKPGDNPGNKKRK